MPPADSDSLSPPSSAVRGRLLVVLAAVLWSTGGFFVKAPDFESWSGVSLAFWRAAFASVVLLPLAKDRRWDWRMAPMVLSFLAMNFFFLTAMKRTEASNAIWLQNTSPIWVLLVNVLWLKQRVTRLDWWMFWCGTCGIAVILTFELANADSWGVVFGLLSAFTYSGVVLSLRGLRDENPIWLIALNHVVTAVALAPVAAHQAAIPEGRQWALLAFFGVLQMGAPYVLFAKGLKSTPSHEAAGITLLEPILTPLWVFIAWSAHPSYEPPRWWTLIGAALILFGLGGRYLALFRRRADRTAPGRSRTDLTAKRS